MSTNRLRRPKKLGWCGFGCVIGVLVAWSCGGGEGGGTAATGARASSTKPPAPLVRCDAAAMAPARYLLDQTQAALTCSMAEQMRLIAARGAQLQGNVFMKVGDSITQNNFMDCFAKETVDFTPTGQASLEETRRYFLAGKAGGTSPFERASLASESGWIASSALKGDPSPLQQEFSAIAPRWAVVMFGTNDIEHGSFYTLNVVNAETAVHEMSDKLVRYYASLSDVVDQLRDWGVVPILMAIPPSRLTGAKAHLNRLVPTMNALVLGIAQARQIPFVDYYRELAALSDLGLSDDGCHPTVNWNGPRCDFTARGLTYGMAVRNWVTIEALDRVRRVAAAVMPASPGVELPPLMAIDAAADAPLVGDGSLENPFVVDRLPFVHAGNTALSTHTSLNGYAPCRVQPKSYLLNPPHRDGLGAEYVYKLEVTETTRLRIFVGNRGTVNSDVYLLQGPQANSCAEVGDHIMQVELQPGTYFVVVDTPTTAAAEHGEYLLAVVACDADDQRCQSGTL